MVSSNLQKRKLVGKVTAEVSNDEDVVNEEEKKIVYEDKPEPRLPAYGGIIFVAVLTFAYLYYISSTQSKAAVKKVWKPEELARYNGTNKDLPLLLSITGSVFDVTKGSSHYGKGKTYNHFCGRDATRAFVTGKTAEESLTDNVANFTYDELHSLNKWRSFYNKTYTQVGVLAGRFYDIEGKPTKALENLERKFKKAELEMAKRTKEEEEIPSCSSKWAKETGGEVWCDSGYPRKVVSLSGGGSAGSVRSRCGCIPADRLGEAGQMEYDNCAPNAQKCITVPP